MTKITHTQQFATEKELIEALGGLLDADLVRIKQIAKLRSAGLTFLNWEDLLNEAITRTLEGSRRWPVAVPFVAFLAQTMRSIANEEWRKSESSQTIRESELVGQDPDGQMQFVDIASTEITPEREIVAENTIRKIEELFAEDLEAMAVLQGLTLGYTPEEIQQSSNITATEYASAQRRIRRTVARHFPA